LADIKGDFMTIQDNYRKIVVPTDCSGWANRAIPHAAKIARVHDAEIILLFVFKPPASEFTDQIALAGQEDQIQQVRDQYKQQLVGLRTELRNEGLNARVQFIEGIGVAHLICDYINGEEEVDLVVMSTHGRTGLARFLFGSVARKIVEGSHTPVLLIRPDKK
jgi:nucleotide-binding universal stress UspA family protein